MISTQILMYTIYNTLCGIKVVVHRFIRKVLHSLTGARVISTFCVIIKTAAIVFKEHSFWQISLTFISSSWANTTK